jgi:hypothetical protein
MYANGPAPLPPMDGITCVARELGPLEGYGYGLCIQYEPPLRLFTQAQREGLPWLISQFSLLRFSTTGTYKVGRELTYQPRL